MILNLVPVLFHLLFYQYLIFQLLVLIRRSLLQEAHSADTADVHLSGEHILRLSGIGRPLATVLDEDSSSLVNISVRGLTTLQSRVLGQEGWFTASEKLQESEF